MVLFDGLAFVLFAIVVGIVNRDLPKTFIRLVFMGIGFAFPIALLCMHYYQLGALDDLYYYTIQVGKSYQAEQTTLMMLKFNADFLLRYWPITIFFIWTLLKQKDLYNKVPIRLFYIIWFACALTAIWIPNNSYGHYFIQAILPFSFIAGDFAIIKPNFLESRKWKINLKITSIAVIIILNMFLQWNDYYKKADYPRIIADDLSEMMSDTDVLYTAGYHQVIYFLLDRNSPHTICTPYHPDKRPARRGTSGRQTDRIGQVSKSTRRLFARSSRK